MDHPNLHIIDKFFEAYGKRDMNSIRQVMSDDARWTFPGHHPLAGVRNGIDEVLAAFDAMGEIMGRSYINVVKLVVGANDDYVVECQHVRTNRADGNNLDHTECVLWRFADGKIVEGTHFFADPEHVNRFFNRIPGKRSQ